MQVHLTLKSSNTKTGKIPVSTTEKNSCPSTCSLKDNGCYAEDYHLNFHWQKVSDKTRGSDWNTFCTAVSKFKPGQLWRHNQAGDLPGENNLIDGKKMYSLIEANKGKKGFTYTHYPLTGSNAMIVKDSNLKGFTINASTENIAAADIAYNAGFPSTVVLIGTHNHKFTTPAGNTIVVCPAQLKDDISCSTCALCQKAERKVIVGFLAHGSSKKKVINILSIK